jgi:hypothetical protein
VHLVAVRHDLLHSSLLAFKAPLICWSFNSSMFKYSLVDQAVPAMCRKRAAARLRADWPSGKAPTTRVRAADLVQDTFKRVIGADTPPMFLGEDIGIMHNTPLPPNL